MADSAFNPSPRMRAFLAAYQVTLSITRAARAAGVSRWAHYRAIETCPEYRERFQFAHEDGVDALEREARRRAVEGVGRLVLYHGKPVMVPRDPTKRASKKNPKVPLMEIEYSDSLLVELLRANAPEKYAQRVKKELTGKDGGPIDTRLEVVFVDSPTPTDASPIPEDPRPVI